MDALQAQIEVCEGMRNHARALENSSDPDVIIAAATEEKYYIDKLAQLKKAKARNTEKVGAGR